MIKETQAVKKEVWDRVLEWCDLITYHSDRTSLDPILIASVIVIESGGQPEVISHQGAVGLMQIMPSDGIASTFTCINGPCFANHPSTEELLDPNFNIEYGTRMLSGLVNKFGLRDGLAKYGPSDVGYWYANKVIAIAEEIRGE